MPKFLEAKLKKEYPGNDHAVYGTMNAIGAMHGNKTTAKGDEMEAKHNAKEEASEPPAVRKAKKRIQARKYVKGHMRG
jgi:hypothetical protein